MQQPEWIAFAETVPDKQYVAILSYLPLRSWWALPYFLYCARRIRGQLKTTSGLIGYSLLAHVATKRFWTLSVWESEVALINFVHKNPHNEAMMTLHRFMGGTQFVRWAVRGSQVPPSWDEAMARSAADALDE